MKKIMTNKITLTVSVATVVLLGTVLFNGYLNRSWSCSDASLASAAFAATSSAERSPEYYQQQAEFNRQIREVEKKLRRNPGDASLTT